MKAPAEMTQMTQFRLNDAVFQICCSDCDRQLLGLFSVKCRW